MNKSTLQIRSTKSFVREFLPLSAVLLLCSCSSIRTTSDPDFRIQPGDTYAWVGTSTSEGSRAEDVPWAEFRRAIEKGLGRRGIRRAALEEANFLVRPRLTVEVVESELYDFDSDPWSEDLLEKGSLFIELLAGKGGEPVWIGECRHNLGYVSRSMSGDSTGRWVPNGKSRSWRVEQVVEQILRRLPMEGGVDRSNPGDAVGSSAPVCQECYDAVTEARRGNPAPGAGTNETLKTYSCPCCKTEMSVYIEDGVHMVRCGGCIGEGVAWDKCRPIDMSTK